MLAKAPHLSPRLIARSLDQLRACQPDTDTEPAALHQQAIQVLVALDGLRDLELPLAVEVPSALDDDEVAQWELVARLLAQAEGVLRGSAHLRRVECLRRVLPGHAVQLLRRGRAAADHLHTLRARVDFVRDGSGTVAAAAEPVHVARSARLQ